jgi:hypothetical protein
MWINKTFFNMLLSDNKKQADEITRLNSALATFHACKVELQAQKAKDDLHLDYSRHRINALERERAVLLNKAAGITIAIPEIVSTRPGTMTAPPDFSTMPSFEDVGDDEAARLGIMHDDEGLVTYRK